MQIGAHDPSVGGNGAFLHALDPGKGAGAGRAVAAAKVNLIARNGTARRGMGALHAGQALVGGHRGGKVQQAQTGRGAGRPFKTVGIRDRAAQHLIAATETKNPPAAPVMGRKVNVPALRAQKGQIGARRL